jgi:hypothetical protein
MRRTTRRRHPCRPCSHPRRPRPHAPSAVSATIQRRRRPLPQLGDLYRVVGCLFCRLTIAEAVIALVASGLAAIVTGSRSPGDVSPGGAAGLAGIRFRAGRPCGVPRSGDAAEPLAPMLDECAGRRRGGNPPAPNPASPGRNAPRRRRHLPPPDAANLTAEQRRLPPLSVVAWCCSVCLALKRWNPLLQLAF